MPTTEERLAALPCFAGKEPKVAPCSAMKEYLGMGDGRTNHNFIVTLADASRYFVRVGLDLPCYGVTRPKEHAACRAVAASGVGAAVVYSELPDVLVTKFVAGRALTNDQLLAATGGDDPKLLAALAQTLRELHATPLPAEMPPPATPTWAPPDLALWIAYARLKGFSRLPLLEGVDDMLQRVESVATECGEAPPACFCHFDLLSDNFVFDAATSGVTVVDFEYAAAGQWRMDLAILSMGCALDLEADAVLLAAYLGVESCPDEELRRFAALKVLGTLRETLWGVVAEVSGTAAMPPEQAEEYSNQNYAKFLVAWQAFSDSEQAWAQHGEREAAEKAAAKK